MASDLLENGPSEGELIVAVVREVKQNGAYVDLDEYEGIEGFIFIGEIASGWVKNIRAFVRPGQRLICKVMRTRKDNKSLELSLKSVRKKGEEIALLSGRMRKEQATSKRFSRASRLDKGRASRIPNRFD